MLKYYLFRKYRKILIVLFALTVLTGGSGDQILNYMAETGDIYDYTILKAIYDNKEKIVQYLPNIQDLDIKPTEILEKIELIQNLKK